MKKIQLLKTINEATTKKMVLDEESYFEGYDFVTNGKELGSFIETDMPNVKIDHRTVVVKWKLKFDMGHIGIYSSNIEIKSIVASTDGNETGQPQPLNLNGFQHNIAKEKNPEVNDIQVFIKSIYINTGKKQIDFVFTV